MNNPEAEVNGYNKYYNKSIDYNKLKNVLDIFEDQGHSGFSASYCLRYLKNLYNNYEYTINMLHDMESKTSNDSDDMAYEMQSLITKNILELYEATKDFSDDEKDIFLKLANFEPLYPIMGTDDEWGEVSSHDDAADYKEYQNKRCSAIFKYEFNDGMVISYYLDGNVYSDNGGASFFTTGRFPRKEISFPYIPVTNKRYIYENKDIVFELTNMDSIKKLEKIYRDMRDSEVECND